MKPPIVFSHLKRLSRFPKSALNFGAILSLLLGPALPVQAGTVAYWRFEADSQDADSSGNGNALTVLNIGISPDVAPRAPGASSAVFDGTSWAQTAGTLDLSAYRNLTIEFFAKSTQTALGMICELGPDVAGRPGAFYCDFSENGSSFRVTEFGAGYNYEYGTAPVQDGNWHHYAATINNSGATVVFNLYVDGVLLTEVTQVEAASPGAFGNDFFNIGSRNAGMLFPYVGQLDEMRISDRELAPAAFLGNDYTDVTFGIVQQPTNTTVAQGAPATFTVVPSANNAPVSVLEYQWLRDGVEIPGANSSSYTLASAALPEDNGAQFSVRITAAAISVPTVVTSSSATLSVIRVDTTGPVAVRTHAPASEFVTIDFDEPLDPTTAGDSTRYTLNGGASVFSAQLLPGNQSVALKVTPLAGPYTVSFTGIGDRFGNEGSGSVSGAIGSMLFADIGAVNLPGYVSATNSNRYVVAATGADLWAAADSGSFVYTNLTGDFDLRVRVESLTGDVNGDTRGGLMVREDLNPGSRNIAALTYANAGNWVVTARTTPDAVTTIPGYPGAGLIPRTSPYPDAWLRIVRAGQLFSTFYSTNGVDWRPLDGGGITPVEPFADTLLVGMVSSQISVSGSAGGYAWFTYSGFQNFVATSGTIAITNHPVDVTILENRPATFSVGAGLQGGDPTGLRYQWQVNNADVAGATSARFTLSETDRSLSGAQIRVVVSAGSGITPVTSSPATLTVTPDATAPTILAVGSLALLPNVVRLSFDEKVAPATANDPSQYTLNGGFLVSNATLQPDGMTVMLDVTGLSAPQFQLTFSGVADLEGNPGSGTLSGSIAGADLTMLDIQGSFAVSSSIAGFTETGFTVVSSGGDIWASADSCNFIYRPLTNDFDVRVQIAEMNVEAGWSRGGLMARVSTDADSPNVMAGSYRNSFATYIWTKRIVQGGETTFATTAQDPSFPNVWVRLQRTGTTFNAYSSPDGLRWTMFGTITDLPANDVWLVGPAFSTCLLDSPVVGTVRWDHFGNTAVVPELRIAKSGDSVVLSWPAGATGFRLQQTGTLGSGAQWTDVSATPVTSDDRLQVVIPATTKETFYRLSL